MNFNYKNWVIGDNLLAGGTVNSALVVQPDIITDTDDLPIGYNLAINMPNEIGITGSDALSGALFKSYRYQLLNQGFVSNITTDDNGILNLYVNDINLTPNISPYFAGVSSKLINDSTEVIENNVFSLGTSIVLSTNYYIKHSGKHIGFNDNNTITAITLTSSNQLNATNAGVQIFYEGDPLLNNFRLSGLMTAIKLRYTKLLTAITHPSPSNDMIFNQITPIENSNGMIQGYSFQYNVDKNDIPLYNSSSEITSIECSHIKYVSGIQIIDDNQDITFNVSCKNVITEFYNKDKICTVVGDHLESKDIKATGNMIQAAYNQRNSSNYSIIPITTKTKKTNDSGNDVSITLYGSKTANASNYSFVKKLNIDRNSYMRDETTIRVKSGTGLYPVTIIGSAYDSEESLANNKELQLIDGSYIIPPSVNYSNAYPSGFDYSSLSGDIYGLRWLTTTKPLYYDSYINVNTFSSGIITLKNIKGGYQTELDKRVDSGRNILVMYRLINSPDTIRTNWLSAILSYNQKYNLSVGTLLNGTGSNMKQERVINSDNTVDIKLYITLGSPYIIDGTTVIQIRYGTSLSDVSISDIEFSQTSA